MAALMTWLSHRSLGFSSCDLVVWLHYWLCPFPFVELAFCFCFDFPLGYPKCIYILYWSFGFPIGDLSDVLVTWLPYLLLGFPFGNLTADS